MAKARPDQRKLKVQIRANYKSYLKQTSSCKREYNTANGKNIAKSVLKGIGKVFCYFGKGLWIFAKEMGRGIQRAYHNYQVQKQIENERRQNYAEIEREGYYEERGRARAQYEFRERDRIRRQNERDERQYWKNVNKMYAVPKMNDNFLVGDAPSRKKKKRSVWDF